MRLSLPAPRPAWIARLLSALFAASVLSFPFHGDFIRQQPIGAFGAFYCGALVTRTGHDPYRTEPLRACERRLPGYHLYGIDGVVEPIPLPGYAIAAFMPLSFLPFKAAFLTFSLLAVVATLAAVAALTSLTGLSPIVVGAALLLSDLYRNLTFAELPPLVIGALSVAAWGLTQRRHWAAAASLGLACIEPHIVLPSLLAVWIGSSAMRRPLFVLAAILLAVSLAVTGAGGIREYFTSVLPAQAQAELPAGDQYSLSWLLNLWGFDDRTALALGSLSYVLFASLGVAGALALARRFKEPAYLMLFPPVTAMIGGSFLHDIQISIALPAALLFVARIPFAKPASFIALLALAMPWPTFNKLTVAVVPIVAAVIGAWGYGGRSFQRASMALGCALAATVVFAGLQLVDGRWFHRPPRAPVSMERQGDGNANASEVWARYVRISGYGTSSPRSITERAPVWMGVPLLSIVAIGSLLGERKNRGRNTSG